MAILDWLSSAGDTIGNYFAKRFTETGHTWRDAWTKTIPEAWHQGWDGANTLARGLVGEDVDKTHALRMYLDGITGMGGGALSGTLGGAFELPVAHEVGWGLDKAYRYGVARPISWVNVNDADARLQAADAAKRGDGDYLSNYFGALFDRDRWVGSTGMWSREVGDVTPGQSLMWDIGTVVGQLNPGNSEDENAWGRSHDPRTPEGQSKYNGENSEFLLKYGSGTVDLLSSVAVDPSHGASLLTKAGKTKYFDNIATRKYVAAGGVEKEISRKSVAPDGTEKVVDRKAFKGFWQAAVDAEHPEDLRWKTSLAHAPLGGSVAPVLWAAAKMGDKALFKDLYLVARGLDGGFVGKVGAWDRIQNKAPMFASKMARLFANWNIGEDALLLGRNAVEHSNAVRSLVLNDMDAFLASVMSGDGLLGSLPGKLMGSAQPRANLAAKIRVGVHMGVMGMSNTYVGKPFAKVAQAFLPSQGWTPWIDALDPSALSLRQVKANLERGGMTPERVNYWTSQWGAKNSPEGRNAVWEQAEADALRGIAERLGLSEDHIKNAIVAMNRYREGTRGVIKQGRVYIAERAARQAARNVVMGRPSEAKALRDVRDLEGWEKKGEYGSSGVAMPDANGELHYVDLPDSGQLPSQAPDMTKPMTVSQTERIIPTLDLRALEGQLKWYMRSHPQKMFTDAETGKRRLPRTEEERAAATIEVSPLTQRLAKTHFAWDAFITASDFANVIWKSTTLLRPAQMPRNIGDDLLRRMLVLGKADLIMGTMTGVKRVFQNEGNRGVLRYAVQQEKIAARKASRTTTATIEADVVEHPSYFYMHQPERVPGRPKPKAVRTPDFEQLLTDFESIDAAWSAGAISLDDFVYSLKFAIDNPVVGLANQVPQDIKDAFRAHGLKIESVNSPTAFADQKPKLPQTNVWHDRQLKRRIIEHYFPDTIFLDHMRREGWDKRAQTQIIDRSSARAELAFEQYMAGERRSPMYTSMQDAVPLDSKRTELNALLGWLSRVISEHINRNSTSARLEQNYNAEDVGNSRTATARDSGDVQQYQPGQIVVNPFTGEIPKTHDLLDDFHIKRHITLDIERKKPSRLKEVFDNAPEAQMDVANLDAGERYASGTLSNRMMNYIIDNFDDLMKPDHLVSLTITPDGNIRMGVAQLKSEAAHKGPVKSTPSAAYQLKNFRFNGILDAGHMDMEFKTRSKVSGTTGRYSGQGGDAGPIRIRAGFGGDDGQVAQHRLSARESPGSSLLVGDYSQSRMMRQQGGWGVVRWNDKGYDQSWERAVNAQLAGDPVARMFLEGKTDTEVLTWLEEHGAAYLHRMHYFGVNYVDHIRQIEGMTQVYVPLQDSEAGRKLRQAVLDRSATREMLDAVEPDQSLQPDVHGASLEYTLGKGALRESMMRGIDNAQKLLSDMPTDKASRFPFFAEAYKRHLKDLVGTADDIAFRQGRDIPFKLMENLETQARERALHDTKYHLYDVAQMNDLARFSRFVVPFSSAIMDSYIKYGRIVRDNPGVLLQGMYYWEMFERNESVQDENGYVLRKETGPGGAEENWYSVDPETGAKTKVDAGLVGKDRYVTFRLPSQLASAKKLYGVPLQPVIAVNKKSFNVFIDLPSTGPLVALPANLFALDNPEFGDTKLIQKFVLPFGPTTSTGKVFLPSTIRTGWDAFFADDGLKAEGQAKAIYQAEMIAYGRGERDQPPSFTEVRERAAMLKGLRFATAFASPLSAQFNSPYQPYIDIYRQMAAVDPQGVDEAFQARYGDEMYAVAMTVTRNNAGVRSTLASDKAFKLHSELIAKYPEMAGLIVGAEGAGEFNATAFKSMKDWAQENQFSKSVYESQKQTPLRDGSGRNVREILSLEDSAKDLEKRHIWQQYSKLQDVLTADMADKGLTSLRGRGAQELVKVRDAFIEANKYWTDPVSGQQVYSPWYVEYSTVDHTSMERRIAAMWDIVQSPDLQKRDDIRGLIDYLTARERTQQEMSRRGFATLDSKQALAVAKKWQSESFAIREGNPAFGALWNRWLSQDDNLALGGA